MADSPSNISKNKWLHVLGAGQWQLPTIQLAKNLGYRVLVTDIYPERPGYSVADAHEVIDIRDQEKTLAAASRRHIDGILCDTTDVGVTTAAYVADKLGLPSIGLETALNFTQKDRMRSLTSMAGLSGPRYHLVCDLAEADRAAKEIGYPVIVKPVDNQSSRGVSCAETSEELPRAVEYAQRSSKRNEFLVEEYVHGTELTVEAFCWKGKVHTVGISDKEHFIDTPQVASQLTYPADLPAGMAERVQSLNQEVIKVLGLHTGPTHAEYIFNEDGVFLVEIAARGGGSRIYSDIVPYLAGIPIPEIVIRWCIGEVVNFSGLRQEPRSAALAFFFARAGRIRSVRGVKETRDIPGVREVLIEVQPGDQFLGIQDDRSRPGFMVAFGRSREDVVRTTTAVRQRLQIEVEDEPVPSGGPA